MRYEIGGVRIEIISDMEINLNIYSEFCSEFFGEPEIKIRISCIGKILVKEKDMLLDDCYKWYGSMTGGTVIYVPDGSGGFVCRMESDKDWSDVSITYEKYIKSIEAAVTEHFIYTVFRILILFRQGIFLHASAFMWQGKGIAATAPSGTGKSTFSSLWELNFGATVINDDCPIIRLIDNKPILFGNPWSGSSKKFMRASVPLTALIIIEQAEENKIRLLGKKEAVERILPRFILPYYDDKLLKTAVGIISEIIINTRVYLLGCRPEKEAAEIVAAEICK